MTPPCSTRYAFQWLAELMRPDQSHFMPRPAAVVLPGSTEEVQAIVRLANKYGLKVKPHGTGWYTGQRVRSRTTTRRCSSTCAA